MAADPRVLRAIERERRRRRLPSHGRIVKSAVETGLVESGLRNLPGGDADSQGWRQERTSLYPDPRNLSASVARYFDEAQKLDTGRGSAGQLAARVQRPAAQYRGRYDQASPAAERIVRGLVGAGGGMGDGGGRTASTPASVQLGSQQKFDEAGFENARRMSLVGQLIAKRRGTGSILFKSGVLSTTPPDPAAFTSSVLTSKVLPGKTASRSAAAAHLPGQATGGGTVKITGPDPGRIVPGLKAFARRVSAVAGEPIVGSDGTGHSRLTVNGNVSDHTDGHATDVPATGKKLIRLGRAALIAAGMPRAQAMKQTGGLFNVTDEKGVHHQIIFNTHEGGDHTTHLHISARKR